MSCSVCSHHRHLDIIRDYVRHRSLRSTADMFGIGYRSLLRHLDNCIPALMEEYETYMFNLHYPRALAIAREHFEWVYRPRRRRSIIRKKVKTSWGRRNWKNGTKRGKKKTL